jgi:hypothetical protein
MPGAPQVPGAVKPAAKTAALPKATVKLQPTPATPQAPTLSGVSTTSVIDDDEGDESKIVPFAALAFVASVVLLGIQLMNFLQA